MSSTIVPVYKLNNLQDAKKKKKKNVGQETQGEPSNLPELKRWSWEPGEAPKWLGLQGRLPEKRYVQRRNTENLQSGPFSSLQLNTDQHLCVRKLPRPGENPPKRFKGKNASGLTQGWKEYLFPPISGKTSLAAWNQAEYSEGFASVVGSNYPETKSYSDPA